MALWLGVLLSENEGLGVSKRKCMGALMMFFENVRNQEFGENPECRLCGRIDESFEDCPGTVLVGEEWGGWEDICLSGAQDERHPRNAGVIETGWVCWSVCETCMPGVTKEEDGSLEKEGCLRTRKAFFPALILVGGEVKS